ncbi:MAG: WecB/TagA/CpsF family glycosyltransferase [Ignavibacteriales bacterium]|nr:WecB/TagA/CpsF family glycosyltransferase [Ignavibacteriales bacterium]
MPKIFNVSIYPFQENELIEYCEGVLLHDNQRKIMYVNIHVLNMAYKDVILQNSLQSADRIYCDGEGVRLGAKILREKFPIRTTGADWIYDLCELCQKKKYSIYFLGGKPSVALNAAKIMRQLYPDLIIAGAADGYFNTESEENEQRIKLINDSKADILLVGLGTPLQEVDYSELSKN